MAAITICSIFGAQEEKICQCFYFLYSIYHEVLGLDAMILCLNAKFQASFFFTFLFHLHQEALSLSSSSLSTLRMVSSAYLRLLVYLLEFCLPACDSSGPTFCMMYPAYKLNKQDDNRKPWCTPFPTLKPAYCSMSSSNCCFLTSIQVSEERGKVFYFFYLFQNFPVCSDPQSQRL